MAPIDTINNTKETESLRIAALQIAISQIGECEQPRGSNSGPMVNEYLKSTGLGAGYAWCAAFVYWCYAAAAKRLNAVNPVVKTAGVRDCWMRSKPTQKLLKETAIKQPELIRPGDQFVLFFGGTTGHTGIVERIEHLSHTPGKDSEDIAEGCDKWVLHTIEGNSNNSGSREGYAVVRHQRELNEQSLQGFIRYS